MTRLEEILRRRRLKTITRGTLTVACYPGFAPVCFYRKNKKLPKKKRITGSDVELIKGFAKACGLRVKLKPVKHFNGIWNYPARGLADVSIGGIGVSDARTRAKTQWSLPYFRVQRSILYNKADPILEFSDIHAEVRGTVGSTGWLDAQKVLKRANRWQFCVPGHSDEQDMRDLLAGTIQGLMRGSFVSQALIRKHPKQLAMLGPWEINPKLVSSDGEVFAFPCAKTSGVAVSLSGYIVDQLVSGELERILEKYGLALARDNIPVPR
jgi:ABC-type amino acid transport substrate-binding protein